MNETQARTLREAHDAYVKRISRKPRAELKNMYFNELSAEGRTLLFGGPSSKDELIAALVELRYPRAKMNESLHVLYHQDWISEVCAYCNPNPCPVCGALEYCQYADGGPGVVNGRHLLPDDWPNGGDPRPVGPWDLAKPALSVRLTDA